MFNAKSILIHPVTVCGYIHGERALYLRIHTLASSRSVIPHTHHIHNDDRRIGILQLHVHRGLRNRIREITINIIIFYEENKIM